MREEFEKLPEISKLIKDGDIWWCDKGEWYLGSDMEVECYVEGAWYAFQEKQKKIDEIVRLIHNETSDYDLDDKIKELLK